MEMTYHQGGDVSRKEGVDEVAIELDTCLVDGVVPSSERDDTGPRERETVRSNTIFLQELDIFLPETVRIGGDVSIPAVHRLSWDAGETVPD